MKILLLHNHYQQAGGEDAVVALETDLLRDRGHEVQILKVDNKSISGLLSRLSAAASSIFSWSSLQKLQREIDSFRPELVHVHNFFPLLSPSVYYACNRSKIPVVQTLHNFRTICPGALLFRNGDPCEVCVGRNVPWPAMRHRCYRQSILGSAAVAAMVGLHKAAGTWRSKVAAYIVLTDFAKTKFAQGEFPQDKLFLKPNFLDPDPGPGRHDGDFALFVGRLSPEKGVRTLMSAVESLPEGCTLKIVGDGPLQDEVIGAAKGRVQIEVLGRLPNLRVSKLMGEAKVLVFPSECYEGFPMVIAEAFARGLPVIASRIGSSAELISGGRTGLLFSPGDAAGLARAIEWSFSHPNELRQMSTNARAEFESLYTAERNYLLLMEVYEAAICKSRGVINSAVLELCKGASAGR